MHCAPVAVHAWCVLFLDTDRVFIVAERGTGCGGRGREGQRPEPQWEPHFCVLLQDEQTLTAYKSEELSVRSGKNNLLNMQFNGN